jgi:IS30 family transposase
LAGKPLTDEEREEIFLGHQRQHSARRIGRRIGRHHTVITREPARNRRLDPHQRDAVLFRPCACALGTRQQRERQRIDPPLPAQSTPIPAQAAVLAAIAQRL